MQIKVYADDETFEQMGKLESFDVWEPEVIMIFHLFWNGELKM